MKSRLLFSVVLAAALASHSARAAGSRPALALPRFRVFELPDSANSEAACASRSGRFVVAKDIYRRYALLWDRQYGTRTRLPFWPLAVGDDGTFACLSPRPGYGRATPEGIVFIDAPVDAHVWYRGRLSVNAAGIVAGFSTKQGLLLGRDGGWEAIGVPGIDVRVQQCIDLNDAGVALCRSDHAFGLALWDVVTGAVAQAPFRADTAFLSNSGAIAGSGAIRNGTRLTGFVCRPGSGLHELTTPGMRSPLVTALNDTGFVAGSALLNTTRLGVLWPAPPRVTNGPPLPTAAVSFNSLLSRDQVTWWNVSNAVAVTNDLTVVATASKNGKSYTVLVSPETVGL